MWCKVKHWEDKVSSLFKWSPSTLSFFWAALLVVIEILFYGYPCTPHRLRIRNTIHGFPITPCILVSSKKDGSVKTFLQCLDQLFLKIGWQNYISQPNHVRSTVGRGFDLNHVFRRHSLIDFHFHSHRYPLSFNHCRCFSLSNLQHLSLFASLLPQWVSIPHQYHLWCSPSASSGRWPLVPCCFLAPFLLNEHINNGDKIHSALFFIQGLCDRYPTEIEVSISMSTTTTTRLSLTVLALRTINTRGDRWWNRK